MVGSANGRVVECSSAVVDRVRYRTIAIPKTPAPPASDADPPTAYRKNAVIPVTMIRNRVRSSDRPQRAGAGVAEWG